MRVAVLLFLAASSLLVPRGCDRDRISPRLATFNIETFPRNERQIEGAFALIAELGVDFVGVQEISDPVLFRAQAQKRLGPDWDFTATLLQPSESFEEDDEVQGRPVLNLGVLYDKRVYRERSATVHEGTRLGSTRYRPTLEVRLAHVQSGQVLQVFVVHLKSGGTSHEIRHAQMGALGRILRERRTPGERMVVLGDFNTTEPEDRDNLSKLSADTGLLWATESLACSAFWSRREDCPTSRLDHVLTYRAPAVVRVAGACAESCDQKDRCPLYRDEISDHCPVVVQLE